MSAIGLLLVQVFGVQKTATTSEIKRAYHKKALKAHPDKVCVRVCACARVCLRARVRVRVRVRVYVAVQEKNESHTAGLSLAYHTRMQAPAERKEKAKEVNVAAAALACIEYLPLIDQLGPCFSCHHTHPHASYAHTHARTHTLARHGLQIWHQTR